MKTYKRSIRKILRLLLRLVLFFLGCFLLFKVAQTVFTVRTITVVGNEQLITNQSPLLSSYNLLLLNKAKLREEILRLNPLLSNVSITRNFPSGLLITLVERIPVLVTTTDTGDFYLDEHGEIIPGASLLYDKNAYAHLICAPSQLNNINTEKYTTSAAAYATTILRSSDIHPIEFTCATDRLIVKFEDLEVYLPYEGDVNAIVSSLHFLLKQFRIEGQHPKAVDLRFEKPVLITDWYRPASSSTAAAEAE